MLEKLAYKAICYDTTVIRLVLAYAYGSLMPVEDEEDGPVVARAMRTTRRPGCPRSCGGYDAPPSIATN